MPTYRKEIKPAVYVMDKDAKGNKQYYKSGPNKGEVKMKIKTPAQYETYLDVHELVNIIDGADVVIIESQGTSFGNSAKSTRSTSMNYGKVLAVAELCAKEVLTVAPHKWKADLNLSQDKQASIDMAEQLSGHSFKTARGALKDGPAEAFLIRYNYIREKEKNEINTKR